MILDGEKSTPRKTREDATDRRDRHGAASGSPGRERSLFAWAVLGALLLVSAGASAGLVVADDFEDGDTNEYSVTVQGGENVGFDAVTDRVFAGDFAGKFPDPSDSTSILATSTPGDGLAAYPSAGDSFTVDTQRDGTAGRSKILFGFQDVNNHYKVMMEDDGRPNPQVHLIRVVDGQGTRLDSGGIGIPDDSWERVEVNWGDAGLITVDFTFTDKTLSAVDLTFSDGGFGYGHQVGSFPSGAAWFDHVVVNEGGG